MSAVDALTPKQFDRITAIAKDRWGDVKTVSRVRARWVATGREGITDARVFNGTTKDDSDYAATRV